MNISIFELFERGGLVMWPILISSVVALAIVIERLLTLTRFEGETTQLLSGLSKSLKERKIREAEQLCEKSEAPLARAIQAGFRRLGRPKEEIRETMEQAASLQIPNLERYVPALGTIAHLTPLMGLLGTVAGLVRCFQVIQEKATSTTPVNPGDLAGGIWEALLTTVFGLLVAIPAFALYNYLAYRVNQMTQQMQVSAADLADQLTHLPISTQTKTGKGSEKSLEIIHG